MAATGLKGLAEGRRDILMMDPRQIKVEAGLNPRDFGAIENREHLDFLKASIRLDGVKMPLTVRIHEGKAWLVDGESRLRAALDLVAEGVELLVPCQAEERGTNEAQRLVDLVTRNTGKRFAPLELGQICKRLVAFGWEQEKVAAHLQCSPSYVSHCLSLLAMPEPVQEMVRQGEVSAAAALHVVRSEGAEAGAQLLQDAREDARGPAPELSDEAAAEAPAPKKVTPKRIEAARAKKAGITPAPKPLRPAPQAGPRYDDAMFAQINKFLGKCIDGTYENEDDEVPARLVRDAKELAETIKMFKRGFASEAAE